MFFHISAVRLRTHKRCAHIEREVYDTAPHIYTHTNIQRREHPPPAANSPEARPTLSYIANEVNPSKVFNKPPKPSRTIVSKRHPSPALHLNHIASCSHNIRAALTNHPTIHPPIHPSVQLPETIPTVCVLPSSPAAATAAPSYHIRVVRLSSSSFSIRFAISAPSTYTYIHTKTELAVFLTLSPSYSLSLGCRLFYLPLTSSRTKRCPGFAPSIPHTPALWHVSLRRSSASRARARAHC